MFGFLRKKLPPKQSLSEFSDAIQEQFKDMLRPFDVHDFVANDPASNRDLAVILLTTNGAKLADAERIVDAYLCQSSR